MVTSFKDLKKHKHVFVTIPPILHRVGVYMYIYIHAMMYILMYTFLFYVVSVLHVYNIYLHIALFTIFG